MTTEQTDTTTTVTTTQPHPVPWCDPRGCQGDEPGYEDRLHMFLGENVPMSMPYRYTDKDGTPRETVCAVFIWQHVREAAPTLGIWSEGGADARSAFEIKWTRAEFIALHAEMGRAIEATA